MQWLKCRASLAFTTVVVVIGISLTSTFAQQRGRIPDRIPLADGSEDIWLGETEFQRVPRSSWSEAAFPRMRFRDFFFSGVRRFMNGEVECVDTLHRQSLAPASHAFSFAESVRRSVAILSGTVNELRRGVFDGTPGLMILADVTEEITAEGRRTVARSVLFFYEPPYLEFAGVPICGEAAGMPAAPAPGHQVLLLPTVPSTRYGGTTTYVRVDRRGVFFESEGRLRAQRAVEEASPELFGPTAGTLDFDDLRDKAAAIVAEGRGR